MAMGETMQELNFTVRIHDDDDGSMWAEVLELPGCFASGSNVEELREAVVEAISLYLSSPGHEVVGTLGTWEHNDDRVTVMVPA